MPEASNLSRNRQQSASTGKLTHYVKRTKAFKSTQLRSSHVCRERSWVTALDEVPPAGDDGAHGWVVGDDDHRQLHPSTAGWLHGWLAFPVALKGRPTAARSHLAIQAKQLTSSSSEKKTAPPSPPLLSPPPRGWPPPSPPPPPPPPAWPLLSPPPGESPCPPGFPDMLAAVVRQASELRTSKATPRVHVQPHTHKRIIVRELHARSLTRACARGVAGRRLV